MGRRDSLVRKTHRRGARRRERLKLALQILLYAVFLGTAVVLSAGVVRVVERPIAPWGLEGGEQREEPGREQAGRQADPIHAVDSRLRQSR